MKNKWMEILTCAKLGIGIIKYTARHRLSLGMGISFLLLGIVMMFLDMPGAGVMLCALLSMLVSQQLLIAASSGFVLSSPKSQEIQVLSARTMEFGISLLIYAVCTGIFAVGWTLGRFPIEVFNYCVYYALFSFILQVYGGIAYKHYLIGFLLYLASFAALYGTFAYRYHLAFENMDLWLPVWVLIVLGAVLIIFGRAVSGLFGSLLYRHDFSEKACQMVWQKLEK